MTAKTHARIFISYSRKDGAKDAASLRRRLEAENFSIWQDLSALQGGVDWWSQIASALNSQTLQHFILVVTPQAMASRDVRREIRLARQEGKTFLPVKGPGMDDLGKLPRWMGQIFDLDVTEHWTTLKRVLQLRSDCKRVPMMAPEPPADFVARPKEFDELKAQLLDPESKDAVAITAALRGAGGYGKTTLAKALAHDPDIQDAYFDGVLWVELGEQGDERVLALISDLVALITGEPSAMSTVEAARTTLAEALGDRRVLLVIDDVWQKHHLDPFLQGGSNATRLITTRFDHELPDTAIRQPVEAMAANEALTLLAWGLPGEQAEQLTVEFKALAKKLRDWAQLLKLANGFLRRRVEEHKQSLASAIANAESRLAAKGLPAFDDPNTDGYNERHQSVAAAIGINLDLLGDDKRARFGELGIFPEDADIPMGVVARLWHQTGRLDEFATHDLLRELYQLSLLLELDHDRQTLRFHDTTMHFLQQVAGKEGLIAQNQLLIQAASNIGGSDAPAAVKEYFYRYLPQHLHDAGKRDLLDALLTNPGWLQARLAATESPYALIADFEKFSQNQLQHLIGRTLRLTAGICARDPRQLLPQLLGRLMQQDEPEVAPFLEEARRSLASPAIITRRPSLTPPGSESARLEGHAGPVNALVVLPDGRLASGSADETIRIWDVTAGIERACLNDDGSILPDRIEALAALPDGRLASSSSWWGKIKLWDLASGTKIAELEDHERRVAPLLALPDGRLASGSGDKTILLWDVATGKVTARLEGHNGTVDALTMLPNGLLASGASDNTIRLWDLASCTESACFDSDSAPGTALAALPDGRLVSSFRYNKIRLWDLAGATEYAVLEGHEASVTALAMLPDGRLVSGSQDATIRLWEVATGKEIGRLEGHTGSVQALAVLPDGRLASASGGSFTTDYTIRLWDLPVRRWDPPVRLHEKLKRFWNEEFGSASTRDNGHTETVNALVPLRDGRLASASSDASIRLWDEKTGALIACHQFGGSFSPGLRALLQLPDGMLLSSARDIIRLWDIPSRRWDTLNQKWSIADGSMAEWLKEDISGPMGLTSDSRLATASSGYGDEDFPILLRALPVRMRHASILSDVLIWLSSLAFWVKPARLKGHTDRVTALVPLPDGRLASGSVDGTVRLWDVVSRTETARLEGHKSPVTALAVLRDGRLASGSGFGSVDDDDDDEDEGEAFENGISIRLWDVANGVEAGRLEGHRAGVTALVALTDGRLASCSSDNTIRLWQLATGSEAAQLEVDASVHCLAALADGSLVAGDRLGRLHWLEIVD